MVWNRWHVDVSARYDRIVSQQVSDTQGTSNRRSDDHISGRASLLYALDNGLSPYLSYSQAITPAMLPGADGKPLKPTTAEQVEAGLKFQPPGSSDLYSIAIYDLTQRMSPLATRTSPPPPIFRRVRSIPRALSWKRTTRSPRS